MIEIAAPTIDAQGILDARNRVGLSQKKFAKALGYATNTIFRWEQGAPIQNPGPLARAIRDLERQVAAERIEDAYQALKAEGAEEPAPRRLKVKPEALAAREAELRALAEATT